MTLLFWVRVHESTSPRSPPPFSPSFPPGFFHRWTWMSESWQGLSSALESSSAGLASLALSLGSCALWKLGPAGLPCFLVPDWKAVWKATPHRTLIQRIYTANDSPHGPLDSTLWWLLTSSLDEAPAGPQLPHCLGPLAAGSSLLVPYWRAHQFPLLRHAWLRASWGSWMEPWLHHPHKETPKSRVDDTLYTHIHTFFFGLKVGIIIKTWFCFKF